MDQERWSEIKLIVQDALDLPLDQRPQFITAKCRNPETAYEVESLLRAYDSADDFIEAPAYAGRFEIIAEGSRKFHAGSEVGKYNVISLLGEGGMGEVYLAEDTRLGRKAAVKVLPADVAADPYRRERFEAEARAASALNHPNIITIYDISEAEGTVFIATEYIEGETLQSRLRRGEMPLAEVLDVALQIASALQAAHSVGVLHRDIKPANVMLRPDGLAKVVDFGIAKLSGVATTEQSVTSESSPLLRYATSPGSIMGTVSYMSPEQAQGGAVDERTDIWSFGIVLCEMLSGKVPFSGETAADVLHAIVNDEIPTIRELGKSHVPPELHALVYKCLSKDSNGRFRSGVELVEALRKTRNAAEGRRANSQLTRDPTLEHRGPFSRLNAATAAMLVTVFLAIAAVGGVMLYSRSTASASEITSLAVLPLKSMDSADDQTGLGIADAIIRKIGETGKLSVRPTSSVRRYILPETDPISAAKDLKVDAVLEGTVQRSGERIRVTVDLIRVSDGTSIWADSFDMRSNDVFVIQDSVAQQVARELGLQLDPGQRARMTKRITSDPMAYEYFTRAMTNLDQRKFGIDAKPQMESTIALFQRAIDADPEYALARAQLAFCYAWIAIFIEPLESWAEMSRKELERAAAIDRELAEIHVVRHMLLYSAYEGYRIDEAINELRLAQAIDPTIGHLELGHLFIHIGLEDEADSAFERALSVDPTSEHLKNNIVGDYRVLNQYDKWLEARKRHFSGSELEGWYYMGKGQLDEAEPRLRDQLQKTPNSATSRTRYALVLALKGNRKESIRETELALQQGDPLLLSHHHVTYDAACVYAIGGDVRNAMKWLRVTAESGFPSYPMVSREQYFENIRNEPEFASFLQELQSRFDNYKEKYGGP